MSRNQDTFHQLNELRKNFGWDGKKNVKKWNKEMLRRAGREEGLLHLPRQIEGEEQKEGHVRPRNILILEEVARRFPGFSFEVCGKEVKIRNYPKVQGKDPGLFDLLIMPPEFADGYNGYIGHTWAKEEECIQALSVGGKGSDSWTMKRSNLAKELTYKTVGHALLLLKRWQEVFPYEPTLAQQKFGVPSLFVRIDCVVGEDGTLGVYEIEDRPSGIGISSIVNEQFRALFNQIRNEWPEFFVVISSRRRHKGDDYLWVEELDFDEALNGSKLILVRAEPGEEELHAFIPRSISTVATKGVKSYGVRLGLWQKVDQESQKLPWAEGFCLKPLQGSKLKDVEIWDPIVNTRGTSLRGDILTALKTAIRTRGGMYLQPLIRPMRWDIKGKSYDGIFRIFFGYSPKSKEWIPLGGCWNARPAPCVRIHGTPETVTGPVILSS